MENLAKFKTIKSMNDRFRNFVTSFQQNERLLSTKFKSTKIIYDDGLFDKGLDLKVSLELNESALVLNLQKRPSRRSLIEESTNLSGSKSARDPFSEEEPFEMEDGGSSKHYRAKALSGDVNNESFSNFSEEDLMGTLDPLEKTEITLIEKFINEIGYKHQIIQLSCQVPILSQLNSLQKEIDTCEKQFNDLLND